MRNIKLAIICIMAFTLSACVKNVDKVNKDEKEIKIEVSTEVKETKQEETTKEAESKEVGKDFRIRKDGKISSFLSGKMVDEAIGNRRPLAVMISNDKEARPQFGLNRADIVYEAPVEGEMNRYMALIEDYDDMDRIGSVRSARTYYTYFAREWDAILAHFGQSTFALPYLKNVDNINGVDKGNPYFYRTKDRKKPHNAYTSAKLVKKAIKDFEYRENYEETYRGNIKFKDNNLEKGKEAKKVIIGYTYNNPYFSYNDKDGLYYRFQYGDKHISDGSQIAVDNIIISYNRMEHYASTEYRDVALHEENEGYFITKGKYIPIKIIKKSQFGTTYYYDMEGNEIEFNPGKTWICIVDKRNFAKTEILDSNGNKTNVEN